LDTTIDWSVNWMGPLGEDPYSNGTVCGYFLNATSDKPILMSGYIKQGSNASQAAGEALVVRALPLTDFDTKEPYYGFGSINFKDISNPILDVLISSSPAGAEGVYRKQAPIIQECLLSWCVQTIHSSYNLGQYSENVTSTYLPKVSETYSWPWVAFEVENLGTYLIYEQNITLQPPASELGRSNTTVFNTTYEVDNVTMSNVMSIFDDFFPSFYTANNASTDPLLRFKNYPDGPSTRKLNPNPWEAPNNLTHYLERMASTLTNAMRSSTSKNMMLGQAYNKENFVDVRWQWLTLPIGLLCIAFIFLAATVMKSAVERDRVGVWKTSAYATLLYGLPDEMQQKITRSSSTGTPRAKAKELKVKLQPNHGWRVSGNLFSPFTPKPKPPQPPPGWI
jgi:hypothetical protein